MIRSLHSPGERRRCTVLDVIRTARSLTLIALDDRGEAHVCLYAPGAVRAAPGDVGTLVFTEGGPMGGYWLFVGDAPASPCRAAPVREVRGKLVCSNCGRVVEVCREGGPG